MADETLKRDVNRVPVQGAITASGGEVRNLIVDDTSGRLKVDADITVESIDMDVEGTVAHDAADADKPIKVGGRARSAQIAAVASDDRTDGIFNLYGERVNAGYDWSTGTNKTSEADPISEHHVEETLAAVTNGADATYYYYVGMDGVKYNATQMTLNGGSGTCTVTCEASLQDDGTAPASCAYQDVTSDLFGVASTTATDLWVIDTPFAAKYIRFKVVASTGDADDADWTLYNKKMY